MNAPNKAQTCQTDLSYCKFGAEALLKLLEAFEKTPNIIRGLFVLRTTFAFKGKNRHFHARSWIGEEADFLHPFLFRSTPHRYQQKT